MCITFAAYSVCEGEGSTALGGSELRCVNRHVSIPFGSEVIAAFPNDLLTFGLFCEVSLVLFLADEESFVYGDGDVGSFTLQPELDDLVAVVSIELYIAYFVAL